MLDTRHHLPAFSCKEGEGQQATNPQPGQLASYPPLRGGAGKDEPPAQHPPRPSTQVCMVQGEPPWWGFSLAHSPASWGGKAPASPASGLSERQGEGTPPQPGTGVGGRLARWWEWGFPRLCVEGKASPGGLPHADPGCGGGFQMGGRRGRVRSCLSKRWAACRGPGLG